MTTAYEAYDYVPHLSFKRHFRRTPAHCCIDFVSTALSAGYAFSAVLLKMFIARNQFNFILILAKISHSIAAIASISMDGACFTYTTHSSS